MTQLTDKMQKALAEIKARILPAKNEPPALPDNARFSLDGITGLSREDVAARTADGRINGDQNIKTKTVGQILRTNTFTFFNMLFVALAVLLIFFVDFDTAGIANFAFLGMVIFNFCVGLFQELKAKRTIDKLSLLSAPKVSAVRDGQESEIKVADIVLDDTLVLHAGNQICADSRVINGIIEVNESLVTGESDPIPKHPGDELLSGSFVVSGSAVTEVIRVGADNYSAKISNGAKYLKPSSSVILRSIRRFIKMMAVVIVPLGIALFCVKYFAHGGELNNTVVTVIGALIGMIPSGLMLLTTGVFCLSVIRLSGYKALAQDLYCTENLARVDVLCLDKTGTITEGVMEVTGLVPNNMTDTDILSILKNTVEAIGDRNPTADAIRDYTKHLSVTETAVSVVPFSSVRKWSAATYANGDTYVFGAAEFVFASLSPEMERMLAHHAENGSRVLVLAKCSGIKENNVLPSKMKLLGYILIADKIRKEAPDTLRYFAEQGVAIKIISGDNPITVKSVAKRAGLADAENYVDASTLTTPDALAAAAEKYTVFGRVTPDQKLALIKALRKNGHSVAMTGDGVNDVLALKEADCSVAMAAGSDAAKNISNLVLLDSNFASMPKIVAEGRRSINNLERSSSLFLVKTGYNFLLAIIFMILQADLPFEPRHFTLIGLVTIGTPSFILALEPNKERVTGSFFRKVLNNALPCSITVALAITATVLCARLIDVTPGQVSSMCTIVTVFIGLAYIAKVSYPFNWMRVTMILVLASAFAASFFANFGFFNLSEFFGLSAPITWEMAKIIIPVALGAIPVYIGVYFIFHRVNKSLDKYWAKLDDFGKEEQAS